MKWYAIYTKPRWEKKVHQLLISKGIESYCPLNKVRRKWSDRIKLVEEPLFKSYVFVPTDEKGKTLVRMTKGVINFVYWDGKPAIVKDKEIVAIKRFLDEYENVQAIDLKPQQRIIQSEEVAALAVFLCGEAARGITMENIQVTGGALW